MKYRVEITPSAEADIDNAYCYIREDSPQNAVTWREGLYDVAKDLSQFPQGYGYALENARLDFDVRQKLYGNYRILYTIEHDRVIVLNVRHAARLPLTTDEITRPGTIDHDE